MKKKILFFIMFCAFTFNMAHSSCAVETSCGSTLITVGAGYFGNCYSSYWDYMQALNEIYCNQSGHMKIAECSEEQEYDFTC